MTTAKRQETGWQLPSVLYPEEFWCYKITVPKDLAYLRALRGAIDTLTEEYNWQTNESGWQNDVAEYWTILIDNSEDGILDGECEVNLCAQILECIEDTEALQQAIANYSNTSVVNNTTIVNNAIANENLITENVGCDDDNLFGAASGIVDLIDNSINQLFAVLAAAANPAGRLGDAIEAIPGIGELPVDDALQMVEAYLEDAREAYDASYSPTLYDDYRCGLYCLAKLDCELSLQDVFDYFIEQLGISLSTATWLDFMEAYISGVFATVQFVHGMHALVAGIMLFGGKIFDLDQRRMLIMVSALFNDPDPDWNILCDCPDTWEHTFDFTVNGQGWSARNIWGSANAVYIGVTGWSTTDVVDTSLGRRRLCAIESPLVADTVITNVQMTYNLSGVSYSAGENDQLGLAIAKFLDTIAVDSYSVLMEDLVEGTAVIVANNAVSTSDRIKLFLQSSLYNTVDTYTGSALITKCVVQGEGVNPFI